jgi:hypothetical protein
MQLENKYRTWLSHSSSCCSLLIKRGNCFSFSSLKKKEKGAKEKAESGGVEIELNVCVLHTSKRRQHLLVFPHSLSRTSQN